MESDTDEEFAREIRETAEKAESLPQSERGTAGFGSSGA